ncbi:MAG: NAD(P)-binding domain-containing protein [Ignavibacteriales bacterium]|nr:NAD(P)-binding domain-containing protein [Ignavibacteriales bacterium]
MNQSTVGFIGGGRIVRIILRGWKRAGQPPTNIVITDSNADVLANLKNEFESIEIAANNVKGVAASDIVFIGLHPPVIGGILQEIEAVVKPTTIVISLAPKVPMAKISEALGGLKNIARAIPNAPSIVNQGYNPIAFSPGISPEAKQTIVDLFRPLGETPEVQEDLLEAYAIFTAMGPTYFWFQLFELQDLVKSFGISAEAIHDGLPKMINGAVKTMFESGLSPAEVMDLIPVKPLAEEESSIKGFYQNRLTALFKKLKG